VKCPRCGKETDYKESPFRPFCSERCKLLDLGNWVSNTYRIPGEKAAENGNGSAIPQEDLDKE
jgi:endogenous inhibitor of DNA gyrase (YacG/DUF329 family)